MNDLKAIEENIEKQLVEIEILSSIYSNLNEFIIEDPLAVVEAKQKKEKNCEVKNFFTILAPSFCPTETLWLFMKYF